MNQKRFILIAGLLFAAIAILHGLRLLLGWEAVIGGWVVPHWISWIAILIFGFLAYSAFKLGRK